MDPRIIINVYETNADDCILNPSTIRQHFIGIRCRGDHDQILQLNTLKIFGTNQEINIVEVKHLEDINYQIYIEGIYPSPGDVLGYISENTTHVGFKFIQI
jgi:hypothetical protein